MAQDRGAVRTAAFVQRPAVATTIQRRSASTAPSLGRVLQQRLGNWGTQALVDRTSSASRAVEVLGPSTAKNADSQGVSARTQRSAVSVGFASSVRQPTTPRSAGQRQPPYLIQAKVTINEPRDVHEREADGVAEAVMRMPSPDIQQMSAVSSAASIPRVQRLCADCEDERGKKTGTPLQRKEQAAHAPLITASVASNIRAMRGGGSALPVAARAFFEPRFGADFSQVRVHTGARAADTAQSINAKAFTVGRDIAFGEGQYAPESREGQRLLAHELTHTIQQSAGPIAAKLQRSPDPPPKSQPVLVIPKADAEPLLFTKGFHAEPINLTKPGALQGQLFVTEANIVEWAAQYIWNNVTLRGGTREKDRLVKLLRRGEDNALHALWRTYASPTLMLVAPAGFVDVPGMDTTTGAPKVQIFYGADNPFSGSDKARKRWAQYLFANWSRVDASLDGKVTDTYVEKIKGALYTKLTPAGATLVKQAQRVKQIEDSPEKSQVPLGRWGATAAVGFEWMGKRMKSASAYSLVFEVIGHEGVYFEMSVNAFLKTDPFVGKVVSDVVKNTKGIAIVGQFIKGFLTALASPILIVLDTAAKVLDMATLGVSAAGKKWGWYDVGYTCLSSTCRNYESCVKTRSPAACQSDAMQQAVEEATIIIPIYRQGAECLEGDAEACGGIAALALGLVEGGVRKMSKGKLVEAEAGAAKGGSPMTKGEFESAVIREAIDRPRPGESSFAKALEEPTAKERPSQSRLEVKKPSEPKPPTPKDLATDAAVDARAAQAGSEVKLGDGKHGVAAAGEGKRAGFHLCSSHCSLVADKLEQIEQVLPEKSAMRRDVSFLKKKVRGLDNEVKSGRLTQEMADRAARDIANGLRDSAGTPIIDTLLQMSIEDLQANRASLKKQVSRAFELGEEVSKEFAEAGKKGGKKELPEGTDATGTTTKPRTSVLTDAEMLAAEMSKDVGPRPPGHEAHHIIPKGMKQAAEARQILQDAGIGINEGANGIWLPKDTSVANPFAGDIHSRVHTSRAIRIMTEQLRQGAKEGPAGVRRALRQIQLTLSDLKFER